MAQQDSGAECERVHVLCRSGKHLPSPHHVGTLRFCLTGGLEDSSQIAWGHLAYVYICAHMNNQRTTSP